MCSVLAEFQSRKAHRVQIRDKDLFKYLCCILVVVVGYMSAWTAVTLDHTRSRGAILQNGVTADNLVYIVCQSKWWNYVIESGLSPAIRALVACTQCIRCGRLLQMSHVAWSVCLCVCVCWAHGCALQNRLNRSRCCLGEGADSGWPKKPCIRLGFRSPYRKG